ncbi:MAG: helix-turn-helix transcriptional regulator [Bacilli bacterium]|jgi:hypothetical protein
MKLTIGEQIMIHRLRANMNQKEFARLAFPDLAAPHMKVQKIEGGRQTPTAEDLASIARVLSLTPGELHNMEVTVEVAQHSGTQISEKVLKVVPKIRTYLAAMNAMADLPDESAIKFVIARMCSDNELTGGICAAADSQPNAPQPST